MHGENSVRCFWIFVCEREVCERQGQVSIGHQNLDAQSVAVAMKLQPIERHAQMVPLPVLTLILATRQFRIRIDGVAAQPLRWLRTLASVDDSQGKLSREDDPRGLNLN